MDEIAGYVRDGCGGGQGDAVRADVVMLDRKVEETEGDWSLFVVRWRS